jgi:RNA polymerase sigma factor (sigma-70 family)
MIREETTQKLGAHESVLWKVFAALARNGYAVPPSDARDLLHDFYLDAWQGLNERFDPKLGSFAGYIAAAFYRFARRRILKMESLARRAVDFESAVAELSSGNTPPEILESRERYQAVSAALGALTPLEQGVLEDYLSGSGLSERQLAQRHRLTRYGVREVLADSVGKVAVTLGKLGSSSKTEANVAELLWKYGQSAREVAAYLNIPVAEVQVIRHQVVSTLLAEIRHPNRQLNFGRSKMKHEEALKLLSSALGSVGDQKSLDSIRKHRGDIQEALDKSDLIFEDAHWSQVEENPEWLAKIYDSLAEYKDEAEGSAVARAIEALRREEEREIGEAFGALIGELPAVFHAWPQWFESVKTVDPEYQKELQGHCSVQNSAKEAFGLTAYGMTPTTLFSAARGLEMLFNRMERAARAGAVGRPVAEEPPRKYKLPKAVVLDFGAGRGPVRLSDDLIIAEVGSTPGLAPGAEQPITRWLFGALQFKPYIIDRYCAQFDQERVVLRWLGAASEDALERKDLIGRWSRGSSALIDGLDRNLVLSQHTHALK